MSYAAMASFVFGEQPSVSRWNNLITNDDHLYSFIGSDITKTIALGYAQITSTYSGARDTSIHAVTGLSAAVVIPSGGRKVKITAYSRATTQDGSDGAAKQVTMSIWDGAVGSGTQLTDSNVTTTGGNVQTPSIAIAVHTPSAGAKTYNVGLITTGGVPQVVANATNPAFILVEAI